MVSSQYTDKAASSKKNWKFEIFALIASILALLSIVAVLMEYDGRQVFSWRHVTLNTVVSTLSTTSKAALMFAVGESVGQWKWILFGSENRRLIEFDVIDSASHGPFGSLKLFWNCRKIMLLRIGALVTLLSLAIDPFTQQLVQLQQVIEYLPDTKTTIARAQRYSLGDEYNAFGRAMSGGAGPTSENTTCGGTYSCSTAVVDISMQSAFDYGINHTLSNIIQQTSFTCPSGNCTWPRYQSLAVCSTCNDVGSELRRSAGEGGQYSIIVEGSQAIDDPTAIEVMLPNGLWMDNAPDATYYNNATGQAVSSVGAVLMSSFGTGNNTATNSFQKSDTMIWGTSFLRMRPDAQNLSAVWTIAPLEVLECALYYCVIAYDSKVVNGILSENETVLTNATRSPNSWQPTELFAENLAAYQRESINFDQFFSVYNRTDLMLGDQFNLSQASVDSVSSYINGQLTGDVSNMIGLNTDTKMANGYYVQDDSGDPNNTFTKYDPPISKTFFENSDIDIVFQQIARSMTNAIRAGSDDHQVQTGQLGTMVTKYRIEWPWISLHVFTVLAGSVFLILTIWTTSSTGAPIWKTSALAALSRGPLLEGLFDGAHSLDSMEKRAASEKMSLFSRAEMHNDSSIIQLDPLNLQTAENVPSLRKPTDSVDEEQSLVETSRYNGQ